MTKSEKNRDPYDGLRFYSALTHGIGLALAALGLTAILLRFRRLGWENAKALLSFVVFGVSMMGLYTGSMLYHSLRTGVSGRLALRKADHILIYFIIAGSYTPICVVALGDFTGKAMLIAIWALAILGSVVSALWISMPRWLTSTIYIAMGWVAVFAFYPLSKTLPLKGFFWLLLGGAFYTLGGVLYALKWPGRHNPKFGCHEVFHIFVLLGSICHFLLMFRVLVFMV